MNAYTLRYGHDFCPLDRSLPASWRASAFSWLGLAAQCRTTARIAGRSAGPGFDDMRRSAIAEARENLQNARERDAWAHACGHRLH